MKSMTGYGNGRAEGREFSVSVEIQSYNNRFLEVKTRLPPDYVFVEKDLVKTISGRLSRGRVNVLVALQQSPARAEVKIDEFLAAKYWQSLQRLWKKVKAPSPPDPAILLTLPGVMQVSSGQPSAREFKEVLGEALEVALGALEKMREKEGNKLRSYLRKHAKVMLSELAEVKRLLAAGPARGGDASASTVQEEINRLDSHLDQFQEILDKDEPAGKVLEFVALEMLRETTTLGDKADDTDLSKRAVAMKSEIENIREQIRNLE